MNPLLGWALAAAALAIGWLSYGLRGLALAGTVIAFWLLLQFNRLVRVMRDAGQSPVGSVHNAVMLNARLSAGMPMAKVVGLTKSLGRQVDAAQERYTWTDAGGVSVEIVFTDGRCASWTLNRPTE